MLSTGHRIDRRIMFRSRCRWCSWNWMRAMKVLPRSKPRSIQEGRLQSSGTRSRSQWLLDDSEKMMTRSTHSFAQQNNYSTRVPAASSSADDGADGDESFGELEVEQDSEFSTIVGGEDDSQNFRITLYPDSNDPVLTSLCEATSVAQVFEIIQDLDPKLKNERHASQAVVSIWDLQKYLHKVGPVFDPERDFANRHNFVENLAKHSSFVELCQKLVAEVHLLEDEPLAATLLCLRRMNWSMRSPECQVFIEECLSRKSTLSLPALSRVCVCLRPEGLYGSLIMTQFLPRAGELLKDMNDDNSVRLMSICLRNMNRVVPTSLVHLYRKNLSSILDTVEFQSVTYCKALLCLLDSRYVTPENDDLSPHHLIREVGKRATSKVPQMDLMEVLSLQRFLEHGSSEPVQFLEALQQRIARFIEEQKYMPRLDLLACIAPFIKRSLEQKKRIAEHVKEYLESYENFEQVAQVLLKIMRVLKLNDRQLYDKYWQRAAQLISVDSMNTRTTLRLANEYQNFTFGLSYCYRHEEFEAKLKKLLYYYLENYRNQKQPCMIAPGDFARVYSFLVAFGTPSDPIFQEQSYGFLNTFDTNFARQCHILELGILARGIAASLFFNGTNSRTPRKYFDQIMDFSSVLEESASHKLLGQSGQELHMSELVAITKLNMTIKRAFGDSPVFLESVSRWAHTCTPRTLDSKLGREITLTLIAANYNAPPVLELLKAFIVQNPESVNADMVAKFLCLTYSMGYEGEDSKNEEAFRICYKIIERNWEHLGALTLLQAALALVYFRSVEPPLVHNIFSAQFLDEVDQELSSSMGTAYFPLKVRTSFMELNRAVCLDLPSANVPWFHKKFCEGMIAASNVPENHFQAEVNTILTEVLGESTAILKKVHSPYFYPINFVVEFDKAGKPIKKPKPSRLFSLSKLTLQPSEPPVEISERVAIIILPKQAFTKNVRSLKGFYKLRTRHLEMLGYRVIHIDPQHWNSMFMSEPYAKHNYLETEIFSRKTNS